MARRVVGMTMMYMYLIKGPPVLPKRSKRQYVQTRFRTNNPILLNLPLASRNLVLDMIGDILGSVFCCVQMGHCSLIVYLHADCTYNTLQMDLNWRSASMSFNIGMTKS